MRKRTFIALGIVAFTALGVLTFWPAEGERESVNSSAASPSSPRPDSGRRIASVPADPTRGFARASDSRPTAVAPNRATWDLLDPSPDPWAQWYPHAKVLEIRESRPDATGRTNRVVLLTREARLALVRVQEIRQGAELKSRSVVVGDHFIVRLKPDASPGTFRESIARDGLYIRETLPFSGLHLVAFDGARPETYERALETLRTHTAVKFADPDYLVRRQN